jgi:hypothetical protein
MSPKEKAEDLVCEFTTIQSNEYDYGINWEMAKQCAQVAVDQILNLDIDTNVLDYWYWQEVKQEIENL